MFKSFVYRSICFILISLGMGLSAFSGVLNDTLRRVDPMPQADSTLIHLKSTEFNKLLDLTILLQKRADSLHMVSIEMRKEASKMDDPVSRGRLQNRIITAEDSVLVLRAMADENFQLLNAGIPGSGGFESGHPFLVLDTVLNGISVYQYRLNEEFLALLEDIREPVDGETAIPASEKKEVPLYKKYTPPVKKETTITKKETQTDPKVNPADPKVIPTEKKVSPSEVPEMAAASGILISESSPYGPGKPFEKEYNVPDGVFYRIQLAVYSKELELDHFGGISPISTETIPDKKLTRYFVGKFTRMEEARSALVKVRALGYPDAFIIGYYDGVKVSFSKLKALEE